MLPLSERIIQGPAPRLIPPFAAGILFAGTFPDLRFPGFLMGGGIIALCIILLLLLPGRRRAFSLVAGATLFLLGGLALKEQEQRERVDWPSAERTCTGILTDIPSERAHCYRFPLEVGRRKVLLYAAGDSFPCQARRGSVVRFCGRIESPPPQEQSGYARWLHRQGIAGTVWAADGKWQVVEGKKAPFSLERAALDVRDRLEARYRQLGFRGDRLALLAALTLGDRSGLREEVREVYSATGVGHVLALSGLHVGILCAVCAFLLSFLPDDRWALWLRSVLFLVVLWGFVFLSGLSPSAVRAACMSSLFVAGQLLQRTGAPLHTLFLSAFLMLLYRPAYLFDIGFQLSYCAVASILLFEPALQEEWYPSSRPLRYAWGLIVVSVLAQMGVLPWLSHYFSSFSPWFLLANVVAVPLVSCVVAGAFLMLACGFCLPLQQGMAWLLDKLLGLLHAGVAAVGRLPFSSVDCGAMTGWEVLLYYVALLCLAAWLLGHKARWLIRALGCWTVMAVLGCLLALRPPVSQLLFYHSSRGVAVQCTPPDGRSFDLFASTVGREEVGRFRGRNVVRVRDNRWCGLRADRLFPVDYLLLCQGFTGRVAAMQELFAVRRVVLDSSLSPLRQEQLREECRRAGMEVISLPEQGSGPVKVQIREKNRTFAPCK